jgi:hypothetical protein
VYAHAVTSELPGDGADFGQIAQHRVKGLWLTGGWTGENRSSLSQSPVFVAATGVAAMRAIRAA